MSAWPDADTATIDRYLRQMRVRHPKTIRVYRGELRRFQRFVSAHGGLSLACIRAWLRERAGHWPSHLVLDRANKVNRFLSFLVADGVLSSQPFEELRSSYQVRNVSRIVRALLSPDPETALKAARQAPPFTSFLGPFLKDHIELRRSLGYRFETQAVRFAAFDRFLQSRPELEGKPIADLVRQWESTATTPEQRWFRQLAGRNLAKAYGRIDPDTPPLKPDARLKQQVLSTRRRPHIYTLQEVHDILVAARSFSSPRSALRTPTLHTMVALAYCAGLRIGELVHLDLGDVRLDEGTITVRDTKFFKSRRLPLTESALAVLKQYLEERARYGGSAAASSPLFWRQSLNGGGRYARRTVVILMGRLLRAAGVKPAGRRGPRFHDMRHSFVSHRMADWYRRGVNPQSHLPYLATYLGHRDIYSTLAYLNTTPELLQLASERFRSYVHRSMSLAGRQP
jgi:integrase/recombinase XerD